MSFCMQTDIQERNKCRLFFWLGDVGYLTVPSGKASFGFCLSHKLLGAMANYRILQFDLLRII